MDLELQGRHVLVTGGSRGIGLACVKAFLAEGARVTLVGRRSDTVAAALAALKAPPAEVQGLHADLRQAAEAEAMVERAEADGGAIDVLVNSAGAAQRTPFQDLTAAHWHAAMQDKFFTYVHVMGPVAQRMGARGRGAIVNVIGMGGRVARPTHLPGGAANAALSLATAGMGAAWASRGVRVNAVNPGLTLTERLAEGFSAESRQQGIGLDEVRARAERELPMGIARPEQIADAVVWLASARAGYVNGAILSMDGALHAIG